MALPTDLPEGMPKQIFKELQKVRVAGRELRISRVSEKPSTPQRHPAGRRPGGRHCGSRRSEGQQQIERKMLKRHMKN